jgi:hypothetical protein
MTIEQPNGDTSPFPSAGEMDLDMWRAKPTVDADNARSIEGAGEVGVICKVPGAGPRDADRDSTARRLEMVGEVYEELRKLADKARAAGIDCEQAERVLTEFVAPKPFPEVA